MRAEVTEHGEVERQSSEGEVEEQGRQPQGEQLSGQPLQRKLAGVALQRFHASSPELCQYVAGVSGDTCFLSFSAGKDSIAAWIQVRRYFKRVIPFYLYLVPGLAFIEEGLRYYEDFFKTEIIRLPHPSLWRMLKHFVFQPPERCAIIEDANLPNWDYRRLEAYVRSQSDAPDAFVAIGSRTADSPIRLANMKRFGTLTPARRSFFAVYDWKIDDVVRELRAANCKLTVDYRMFGRSFDGIDYRFLGPIKERYPEDYARILDWFPLADLEIFRREMTR